MNNEIKLKKLSGLRVLCISASNRIDSAGTNSYRKCKAVLNEAGKHISDMQGEIIELQNYSLNPCTACSKCKNSKRCAIDSCFNEIYEKIIACDVLFIIVPHYALAPAKLCMLLEKMGQVVSIHSSKDKSYKSETFGLKTAIITHGATAINEIAQKRKKRILNDPIAVALYDPQVEIIPFSDEWETGICVQPIEQNNDGETLSKINEYVRKVINTF
jgi:Multimeric flavodoxin WrbA